jgi:malate/lactate dehydrogenase
MALSLPCIVGKQGVEQIIPLELNQEENGRLTDSINVIKKVLSKEGV